MKTSSVMKMAPGRLVALLCGIITVLAGNLSGQVQGIWPYRQKITVFEHLAKENLVDFPLLVKIADASNPVFSRAQPTGFDLVFTEADGNTLLDHEIELFDNTDGQESLVAWVRIPQLEDGVRTNIYMYYGRADISDQSNASGVWDSHYEGVWHLDEDKPGTGTAGVYKDSTVNARHGTDRVTSSDKSGKIGRGQGFSPGTTDSIPIVAGGYLDWSEEFTISAWIKTSRTTYWSSAVGAYESYYPYLVAMNNTGQGLFGFDLEGGGVSTVTFSFSPSPSDWTLVTVTRSATNVVVYQNGEQRTASTSIVNSRDYGNLNLVIGASCNKKDYWRYWDGGIDEVRLSSSVRSQGWIDANYRIMADNEAYLGVGAEEQRPLEKHWDYRQAITVSGDLSTGGLADFPLLVSIANPSNPVFENARADGSDILFVPASNQDQILDHEIEYYSSVAGSEGLYIWVRVPELPGGTDTTLYMYYGNDDCGPQSNSRGVWDRDFVGVYHMGEGAGLATRDSTLRNNHAEFRRAGGLAEDGPVWTADSVAGNAVNLDGEADYLFVPSRADMPLDRQITQEIWIKLDTEKVNLENTYSLFDDENYSSTMLRLASPSIYDGSLNYWVVQQEKHNSASLPAVEAYNRYTVTAEDFGKWVHLAGSFDGTNLHLFRNGVELTRHHDTSGNPADTVRSIWQLYIGCANDYGLTQFLPASVDEARISRVARSPEWMAATYRVMAENSTCVTVGRQEKMFTGLFLLIR